MSDYKNLKVVELREIARSRGLRGYSRLRKSDLISFIKDNENTIPILDEDIPSDLPTPSLIPAQYIPPKTVKKPKTTRTTLTDWERWLTESVLEPPKKNVSKMKRKILELYDQTPRISEPQLKSSALNSNVQKWFIPGDKYIIPDAFLKDAKSGVKKVVDDAKGPKKTYTSLKCVLVKVDLKTGDRIYSDFNGRSKTHTVTTQLGNTYEVMKDKMLESLAKYQKEGSGWQLYSIVGLDISIVKFRPLSGSGYSKLPPAIAKKKAVINIKNEDDQCFKWTVTRALNPTDKNPDRITKELKEQSEKLNWDGITFPVKIKDIPVWEKNNETKVNVFGYDNDSGKLYAIKISDQHTSVVVNEEKNKKFVNLYLHDDNHYCAIKNLGRLVSSQMNKHQHKKHFCLNCMNGFGSEKTLTDYQEVCLKRKPQTETYSDPGDTTKFKNYERLHDVPFVVYADFECLVKPLKTEEKDTSQSFTTKYQSHDPSGFCYTIKCMDETIYPTKTVLRTMKHENEDMGKSFVETLSEDLKPIYEILKTPKPMVMSDSDKTAHEKSENCYACGTRFGTMRINERTKKKEKIVKCRDHCHITGKYRGAACDKCNLRMRVPKFVPVLFHNLEGYDSHLFVKSLGLKEGDIKCIPKTDEKYISFSKNVPMETLLSEDGKKKTICLEMRFLDSLKFTLKSLDALVKTLGKNDFRTLTSQMSVDSKSLELLKRKGVFPYEYMTDFSRLGATCLPPKEAFYSQLSDSHITDSDYAHAQNVWKTFGCKSMEDYHDLYLKTDVLLLADVMMEFRKTCKKAYGLEALHYYTSPGLAWDAMLKHTGI